VDPKLGNLHDAARLMAAAAPPPRNQVAQRQRLRAVPRRSALHLL